MCRKNRLLTKEIFYKRKNYNFKFNQFKQFTLWIYGHYKA